MTCKTALACFPKFIGLLKPTQVNQINTCLLSRSTVFFSTDNPSSTSTLKEIYYGALTPQVKAVKFFGLSSSAIGIMAQPFLYEKIMATGNLPIIIVAYSFVGFFTFLSPFLFHVITKKYVTHLLYNQTADTYVAKTMSLVGFTRETEFRADDVKVPDVPGMFTTFIANGRPLLIDSRSFENLHHYSRIMGYDKPMDFKLYETPPSEKKPQ